MKRLFLALAALIAYSLCVCAKDQLIFTCISQDKGLTSTVNSIYKEKDGDVWMGSPSALYQFNGHTLRQREDELLDERSINCIIGDDNGDLWVLTDKWLLKKLRDEDSFELVRIPEMEEDTPFYGASLDEKGIWFGSRSRLFRYTYKDKRFTLFCEIPKYEDFDIRDIHFPDSNTLLCSANNGLLLIDRHSGKAREASYGSRKEISALLTDSSERIWIASYNNGIEVYEKGGRLIRKYNTGNSALSNNIVLCMTEKDSTVWAGTDGGGINMIDFSRNSIDVLSHVSGDASSFPAHSIKSIYTDQDGNIWAGSVRNGLIRISSSGIMTYTDCHLGLSTGLSNPTVTCLFQEKGSGKIWIGTDGEGANMFDLATRKFTHFPKTFNSKVVSIASYSDTELAMSVYGEQIILFNKKTGETRPLELKDEEFNYLMKYTGRSINLANEADGSLLLISHSVKRLNREDGSCHPVSMEVKSADKSNLFLIGQTEDGTWFHDSHSLFLLRPGEEKMFLKGRLENEIIRSGDICSKNIIWLATSAGLQKFDIGEGRFSHISTSLFEGAFCVSCDRKNRVWVGTDKAMYAYLIDSGSFALFGESDGVKANEFLPKPHLLAESGDIFLGGVMGLIRIDSEFSTEGAETPKLKLYNVTVDNTSVKADRNGRIKIPRNCKNLKIIITTQEKDIFRSRMYHFTIAGKLNHETSRPVLELKHMPAAGRYDIYASCTQRDGEWNEPVKITSIKIPQPWYLSWWFLLLLSAVVALVIWAAFMMHEQKKESELKKALQEQEQRLYEEKVALLINMSHELRTPLTLIMAPLKRMLSKMGPEHEEYNTLNRIHRQSRRMKDLLNMALDLRKMEVGKSAMKIESHDFNSWLSETTEDLVMEGRAEGIEICCDLDPRLADVSFDRVKCETVMLNILMNAIKHSTKGDRICIKSILTDESTAMVSVSDTGPGLRDADPEKIFTSFYQSNNERYGSGLGLAYSKILIDLHGGQIGAYDNADKGATFWWEIPILTAIESSGIPSRAYLNEIMGYDPVNPEIGEDEGFSTAGMTLMLVDDNKDLLDFLCEALSTEFQEILTACSGNKALEHLAHGHIPDIIVSDINMPDGDGYTLCRTLRKSSRFAHIPVILLTARGDDQSQSDSYRIGAESYLPKPFEVETLMEMARNILRKKAEIRKKYLDTNKEEAAAFTSKEEDFILKLNRLIGEHMGDPGLDQQLICRELGVSRALLYNKMKALTGTGAKEYITRIRLEKAKSLIESTDLTIAEISEITGFSTQSYFSTAFKGYTGKSPSQYKASFKA